MCLPIVVDHPEKLEAKGEHLGYEWNIVPNATGHRCGYVRVPKGHPWYGKPYDDVEARVHGGLTFSEHDKPCGKGGPDDGYWVGFDCAHWGDAPDPSLPGSERMLQYRALSSGVVRTREYVIEECRSLCEQASRAASIDAE